MTTPDQSPLPAFRAAEEILDAQEAHERAAIIVPVDGPAELVGRRVVIRRSDSGTFRRIGSFGDETLDEAALALAERALEDPTSTWTAFTSWYPPTARRSACTSRVITHTRTW